MSTEQIFGEGVIRRVASMTTVIPSNELAGPLSGANDIAGSPVCTLTVEDFKTVVLKSPWVSVMIIDPATLTGREGTGVAAITT